MSLSAGTRLGPYEITGPLGAGGMGEVYRARDSRLNRDVAIKTLPAAFFDDANRMARLQREAQVLASLNHPNIASIYGLEEERGVRALVMELVDGPTLAERIAAGAIPLDEALAIAHQIADALEAAHEKGIVHRDLKPANVKVTPGGRVKVLDFGLAKAFEKESASGNSENSPTLTLEATRTGVIMGTAGYMSPEQARGKSVDKRADIWAFGVVLYEMLAGRSTFEGETISDTLAAVLKTDPAWSALPADTPPYVRRLLRRCLERDPNRRLRDIGDAWIEMDRPVETASVQSHPVILRWAPWTIAALAVAALAVTAWRVTHTPAPPGIAMRFAVTLPNVAGMPEMSRDGTRLVYSEYSGGSSHLALRMMDQLEARPIAGTENGSSPAFSPDGQWVAYVAGPAPLKLRKIPVAGGASIALCDAEAFGESWGDDETIVFGSKMGLMRVPAAGGKPQPVTTLDAKNGEWGHYFPRILPGGQAILYSTVKGPSLDARSVAVIDLKTHAQRVVANAVYTARYVPTGYLVYARAGTLFAVPFDLKGLAVTGAETPVVEGVSSYNYTLSDSGLLVYKMGGATGLFPSTLEWTDRKGAVQPLPEPPHAWNQVVLSPDGKRAAASIWDRLNTGEPNHSDIWIYDPERGTLTRLTFEGSNGSPVWSPDGRWVAFSSHRGEKYGIYRVPADASGQPELLLATDSFPSLSSWTPDGKTLLYVQYAGGKGRVSMLPVSGSGGESKPRLFLESTSNFFEPQVSPDGKWAAYTDSNGARKAEIFVIPFPGPGGKFQISTQGGERPNWSHNGRELFYVERDTSLLMAVDIRTGPPFVAGRPHPLFKLSNADAEWSETPDGQRFLVERVPELATTFVVVTNWFEDLLRRAPKK